MDNEACSYLTYLFQVFLDQKLLLVYNAEICFGILSSDMLSKWFIPFFLSTCIPVVFSFLS